MQTPPVPEGFFDLFEAAFKLALKHWKFILRWAGWYLLSLAGCVAAGGAAVWFLWVPLFAGATHSGMENPLENPFFVPAVLGGAAVFMLFLAAGTAAFISSVRALRDLWSGAVPANAGAYLATGWREVITSIPFYLRAVGYWLWPVPMVAAGIGATLALTHDTVGNALSIFIGVLLFLGVLVWTVFRSVQINVTATQAALSGDWSGESFGRGLELVHGRFWRVFGFTFLFGLLIALAQNIAIGLPVSVISGILSAVVTPLSGVPFAGEAVSIAFSLTVNVAASAAVVFLQSSFWGLLTLGLGQAPAQKSA